MAPKRKHTTTPPAKLQQLVAAEAAKTKAAKEALDAKAAAQQKAAAAAAAAQQQQQQQAAATKNDVAATTAAVANQQQPPSSQTLAAQTSELINSSANTLSLLARKQAALMALLAEYERSDAYLSGVAASPTAAGGNMKGGAVVTSVPPTSAASELSGSLLAAAAALADMQQSGDADCGAALDIIAGLSKQALAAQNTADAAAAAATARLQQQIQQKQVQQQQHAVAVATAAANNNNLSRQQLQMSMHNTAATRGDQPNAASPTAAVATANNLRSGFTKPPGGGVSLSPAQQLASATANRIFLSNALAAAAQGAGMSEYNLEGFQQYHAAAAAAAVSGGGRLPPHLLRGVEALSNNHLLSGVNNNAKHTTSALADDDDVVIDEDDDCVTGGIVMDDDYDGLVADHHQAVREVGEHDFYDVVAGPNNKADGSAEDDYDDGEVAEDHFNEAVAEKLRRNLGGGRMAGMPMDKGFKTVQLDQNEKGRGLVATRHFPARTIITSCRPDIAVLYSSHVKSHCAHCYQPLPTAANLASSSNAVAQPNSPNDPRANGGGAVTGVKNNAAAVGGAANPNTNATTGAANTTNNTNSRLFGNNHHHGGHCGFGGGSNTLHPSFYICEFCFNFALCESCNTPRHWDEHHLPCRWFSTLPAEVQENDTDYIRFLLNYCARIQGGDRRLMYAVENLCSNEDAQRENVKRFCSSYSKLVATTFAPQGLLISQQHLYHTLLRTKSNAIGFPFDSNATLGWAVQLDICMVNHSCNPNCAITQAPNGCIELRALRQIFEGDEITIAYINIPAFQDVRTRIAHLWSEYRFKCSCELCEEQTKQLIAAGGTLPKLTP